EAPSAGGAGHARSFVAAGVGSPPGGLATRCTAPGKGLAGVLQDGHAGAPPVDEIEAAVGVGATWFDLGPSVFGRNWPAMMCYFPWIGGCLGPTDYASTQNNSVLPQGPVACSDSGLACGKLIGEEARKMRRREFITLLGAASWPLVSRAQQPERVRRVGVLLPAAAGDSAFQTRMGAFLQGLQQLGWADGRNALIDTRWATAN